MEIVRDPCFGFGFGVGFWLKYSDGVASRNVIELAGISVTGIQSFVLLYFHYFETL